MTPSTSARRCPGSTRRARPMPGRAWSASASPAAPRSSAAVARIPWTYWSKRPSGSAPSRPPASRVRPPRHPPTESPMPKPARSAMPDSLAEPSATRKWYQIRAAGDQSAEVLIYGDIGESWFSDTSVTARQFAKDLQALDATRITARINSYGGSVADGLAIHNALRDHPASVETVIDGVAVSIASLIAKAGATVSMHANALYMMHAPSGGVWGNATDMRDMAGTLDAYAQAMSASYARKTGKPAADMLALLTDGADHWYPADQALAGGFIDRILDAPATQPDTTEQAAASFAAVMARY